LHDIFGYVIFNVARVFGMGQHWEFGYEFPIQASPKFVGNNKLGATIINIKKYKKMQKKKLKTLKINLILKP
jgi:hypothetical protein